MEANFTVYVLYSFQFNKIYIGYTSNLINRFHSHNSLSSKGYTIKFRPWIFVYGEYFNSKSDAMKREKQLKSANGRKFIYQYIDENYKDNVVNS